MKQYFKILILLLPSLGSFAESFYLTDFVPSAPAAGAAGSTALHKSNPAFMAWADGVSHVQYGAEVDAIWRTPEKALGPAEGTSFEIVSLGRGGQITLSFSLGIGDRVGADFFIFENAISDEFLELAYVEVSSDGINFVRFPNYSTTPSPVGAYGGLFTQWIYGLGSKYRQGYGTPFDLNALRVAYTAQLAGATDFSPSFATALTNGFPQLDLNHITHVRLIDVIGDGSALDARGSVIYDPYVTVGSAGFDLDAIGVLNEAFVSYADWAALHTVSPDGLGDADGDGVIDFQEYRMGGNPNLASSVPVPTLTPSTNGWVDLKFSLRRDARGSCHMEASPDLVGWSNAIPQSVSESIDSDFIHTTFHFLSEDTLRFYRLIFALEWIP